MYEIFFVYIIEKCLEENGSSSSNIIIKQQHEP